MIADVWGPLTVTDQAWIVGSLLIMFGFSAVMGGRQQERARRASPGSGHQGSAAPAGRAPQLRKEADRS